MYDYIIMFEKPSILIEYYCNLWGGSLQVDNIDADVLEDKKIQFKKFYYWNLLKNKITIMKAILEDYIRIEH